jgi:periplasmic divalent cation tolerance protein
MTEISGPEKLIMVYVTCGSEEEATSLSDGLVREHLAACVNIIPIRSVYEWKEKLENQPEWLLVIKSTKKRFGEIERFVRANHSYELPEIISVDIAESSSAYSEWINGICG